MLEKSDPTLENHAPTLKKYGITLENWTGPETGPYSKALLYIYIYISINWFKPLKVGALNPLVQYPILGLHTAWVGRVVGPEVGLATLCRLLNLWAI